MVSCGGVQLCLNIHKGAPLVMAGGGVCTAQFVLENQGKSERLMFFLKDLLSLHGLAQPSHGRGHPHIGSITLCPIVPRAPGLMARSFFLLWFDSWSKPLGQHPRRKNILIQACASPCARAGGLSAAPQSLHAVHCTTHCARCTLCKLTTHFTHCTASTLCTARCCLNAAHLGPRCQCRWCSCTGWRCDAKDGIA